MRVRKHEAKNKTLDRLSTCYSKSVVAVLKQIIETVQVGNWKTDGIEGIFSKPKTAAQIAFSANLQRRTVCRALRVLLTDGFITASSETKNSYRVNTERILSVASNYVTRRTQELEGKITNVIRMRFNRWDGLTKIFCWPSTHMHCKCERPFCSHPTA